MPNTTPTKIEMKNAAITLHGAIRGGQLAISMRATLAAGAHPQRAR